MKTFFAYLGYRCKSSLLRTGIFAIAAVLCSLSDLVKRNQDPIGNQTFVRVDLFGIVAVMTVLAVLLPILETSCFKSRRHLDRLYCFPLPRRQLALAHDLSGWLQMACIHLVSVIAIFLFLLTDGSDYAFSYLWLFALLGLIGETVIYAFAIFCFGEGNTVIDGILFTVLWAFGLWFFFSLVWEGFHKPGVEDWCYPFQMLRQWADFCQNKMVAGYSGTWRSFMKGTAWEGYLLWLLAGGLCTLGYLYTVERRPAHQAGELSSSWFGYRILIPVLGGMWISVWGPDKGGFLDFSVLCLFLCLFGLVTMAVGYVIYRRSVKLRWSDLIVLGCAAFYAAALWI